MEEKHAPISYWPIAAKLESRCVLKIFHAQANCHACNIQSRTQTLKNIYAKIYASIVYSGAYFGTYGSQTLEKPPCSASVYVQRCCRVVFPSAQI